MKNRQSKLLIYLPIMLILTAVAVVFRSVALSVDFNFESGYYTVGILSAIADWTAVISVAAGLSYFIFGDKDCHLVASYDGPATFIPSLLVGSTLVFITVDLGGKMSVESNAETVVRIANIISFVLAAVAAYSFFITAYKTARRDTSRASVQIGALLFFAVYAAYIYFANPLPINSPNRMVDITAYLLFASFFIYEVRISLGRDLWKAYTAFGLCALALTAYSSIPSLVIYLSKGIEISHSIYETVLTLSLFIFVLLRLARSLFLFEDIESDVVEAIKLAEQSRIQNNQTEELPEEVADDTDDVNENYTIDLEEKTEQTEKEAE